jgi:hypothetical protein
MSDKPKAEPKTLRELGLESYTTEEMHRSALVGSAYNPRKITDSEREQLKIAIKRHGLVSPITWNRRTSRIVGGHQRISILDSLAGTKDYTLSVAVIDVDEAREKELNLLLNNDRAMGEWDWDGLRAMFDDENVTLAGAGFSHTDMVNFFGTDVFNERREDLQAFAEKMASVASQYDNVTKANAEKAASEFFLVFVFKTSDEVDTFCKRFELPPMRYQNGHQLMRLLGMTVADDVEPPRRRGAGTRKKAVADSTPAAPSGSA